MIFVVVIVILLIAASVSIFRALTGGTESVEETDTTITNTEELLNTSIDHSVLMRLRSEIVADENFRTYEVEISPTDRQFTRYKGYLDEQLVYRTYENNTPAYDEFVHALNKAGLTRGVSDIDDDVRGVCANGILFEFELRTAAEPTARWWTSTCDGSPGTLDADADYLRELFLDQVPRAVKFVGNDNPDRE